MILSFLKMKVEDLLPEVDWSITKEFNHDSHYWRLCYKNNHVNICGSDIPVIVEMLNLEDYSFRIVKNIDFPESDSPLNNELPTWEFEEIDYLESFLNKNSIKYGEIKNGYRYVLQPDIYKLVNNLIFEINNSNTGLIALWGINFIYTDQLHLYDCTSEINAIQYNGELIIRRERNVNFDHFKTEDNLPQQFRGIIGLNTNANKLNTFHILKWLKGNSFTKMKSARK